MPHVVFPTQRTVVNLQCQITRLRAGVARVLFIGVLLLPPALAMEVHRLVELPGTHASTMKSTCSSSAIATLSRAESAFS